MVAVEQRGFTTETCERMRRAHPRIHRMDDGLELARARLGGAAIAMLRAGSVRQVGAREQHNRQLELCAIESARTPRRGAAWR